MLAKPLSNDDARIINALRNGTVIHDDPLPSAALLKASPRADVLHAFDAGLRVAMQGAVREYNPNGGQFGRGPQIRKSQLAGVAIILAGMGFRPYVFDHTLADEFGQAFPLYSVSGGLTAMAQRVWTRERDGKYECIPFEYCNLKGLE